MKKIVLFSLIACLGFVGSGFAKGDCKLTTCEAGGSKGKGLTLLNTKGERSHEFASGQCYRCNWGKNNIECSEGTYVAIKHPTNSNTGEIKGIFKCVDSKGYNDDWIVANPVDSCDATEAYKFSRLNNRGDNWLYKSDENASKHYIAAGDATSKIVSGDNAVSLSGSMGCVVYLCKKGYHADSTHMRCIKGECDGGCDEPEPTPGPTPNPDPNTKGCEENDGTIVPVGRYSNYDSCPWDLDRDGAALCSCQCIRLNNVGLRWKCDVNKCKGDSESVYHYNKDKTNVTGGKGVCEEKKGNYCDKYKKYTKRYACCIAGKATKWNGNDMSDNGTCECVDKNKVWDGKKCVAKPQNDCERQYHGNPEAIACCRIGRTWSSSGHTCLCDDGYEWKYNSNTQTGECIAKVKPDDTSKPCTPSGCKIKVEQGVKCPNGNYLSETQTFEVCEEDLGTIECDKFQMKVNDCRSTDCVKNLLDRLESYDAIIEHVCRNGSSPVNVPGRDSEGDVVKAQKTLDDFYAYAKGNRSVWKDGEGKFNTTRLASDLTAGVVLGTVGGVVSGVVIKKKQVEKGFDALHCTVGGQTVADWGDTFNVGLR